MANNNILNRCNSKHPLPNPNNLLERRNKMETNITIGRNKNKHLKIDLKNYPNILITGLDDYSKSDLVSNILYELISKNKKEEVKILPIDVKGIDYKIYDNSSHFISPIIKETKYIPEVLKGLLKEIETREKAPDLSKYPLIITLISEFDDLMLEEPKEILPLLEEILEKGRNVNIYTILSTLYLDEENYQKYIYRHFDITASFFDRSKSKYNKFKFTIPNDKAFNLKSKDNKVDIKLKNITISTNKIEEMLHFDK